MALLRLESARRNSISTTRSKACRHRHRSMWTGRAGPPAICYHQTTAEAEQIRSKSSLADVKQVMQLTRYPWEKLIFVPGRVEQTLPAHAPDKIALLRLDTHWYESTYHELEHLYPPHWWTAGS